MSSMCAVATNVSGVETRWKECRLDLAGVRLLPTRDGVTGGFGSHTHGRQIPLSAVATIQQDRGPNFVMRQNVQRRMVVQSNVTGRDLRSVHADGAGGRPLVARIKIEQWPALRP